ncbi:unnamed protein product, partial [marine sediment metagenome]
SKFSGKEIDKLLDPTEHLGDARERCKKFVNGVVKPILLKYKDRLGKRHAPKF